MPEFEAVKPPKHDFVDGPSSKFVGSATIQELPALEPNEETKQNGKRILKDLAPKNTINSTEKYFDEVVGHHIFAKHNSSCNSPPNQIYDGSNVDLYKSESKGQSIMHNIPYKNVIRSHNKKEGRNAHPLSSRNKKSFKMNKGNTLNFDLYKKFGELKGKAETIQSSESNEQSILSGSPKKKERLSYLKKKLLTKGYSKSDNNLLKDLKCTDEGDYISKGKLEGSTTNDHTTPAKTGFRQKWKNELSNKDINTEEEYYIDRYTSKTERKGVKCRKGTDHKTPKKKLLTKSDLHMSDKYLTHRREQEKLLNGQDQESATGQTDNAHH